MALMSPSEIQVSTINIVLSAIILFVGIIANKKHKNPMALAIGISFAFFGSSHIFLLLDKTNKIFISSFIIFRIFAYLMLIFYINKIVQIYFLKFIHEKRLPHFFILILNSILSLTILGVIFYSSFYMYGALFNNIFPTFIVYSLNAFLCLIILLMSIFTYIKSKNISFLFLSISFVFFMLSHILVIYDPKESLIAFLVIARMAAYLFSMISLASFIGLKILNLMAKYTSHIYFQISVIIMTIFILIILFYFPQAAFNTTDPKVVLSPIIPLPTEEKIVEVKTGLYIKSFPSFNIVKNEFIMNAVLWFEFDPHLISIETLEKFSFENGTILQKSDTETKIIADKLLAKYRIRIQFKSSLNYHLFPLEDHVINVTLINTHLNPTEVVLTTKNTNLIVSEKIFTEDWNVVDKKAFYGYSVSKIDKYNPEKTFSYPTVVFSLDFEKAGIKNTLIIFVPLFVAFFLCLFSLMLNIKNIRGILSLTVGSISSLIVVLFVIEARTPDVRYFTISDSIHTLLLLNVFAILLFNMYVTQQASKPLISKNLILIRNFIFLFFVVFTLLFTHYLLY